MDQWIGLSKISNYSWLIDWTYGDYDSKRNTEIEEQLNKQ